MEIRLDVGQLNIKLGENEGNNYRFVRIDEGQSIEITIEESSVAGIARLNDKYRLYIDGENASNAFKFSEIQNNCDCEIPDDQHSVSFAITEDDITQDDGFVSNSHYINKQM